MWRVSCSSRSRKLGEEKRTDAEQTNAVGVDEGELDVVRSHWVGIFV